MDNQIVTILCSGVALGVYIPAISVDYQLRTRGISTEVIVLENLLLNKQKAKILSNKKSFHENFRLALTGQKMARDLWPSFDLVILENLFKQWHSEKRRNFIIVSGFWMSIIKEYANRFGTKDLNIDIMHIDSDISPSWKIFSNEIHIFNNIWLFSWKERKLIYELYVPSNPPVSYKERLERYVIHGGGWGMGTYQSKIPELEEMGINLDIVVHFKEEALIQKPGNRYFMVDPSWSPWLKNKDNLHEFPLFGEVKKDQQPLFKNRPEYHEVFDLIRFSKAIISKPGGSTMVDSLASATPLIMLEPFGEHEGKNAELWETLGYGISYQKWVDSGYSHDILEKLHNNLLKARGTMIDYCSDYIRRNYR